MYPNLRFAFYDWFGLDLPFLGLVQSFGFLMALSFLVAGLALSKEFQRREGLGLLQPSTVKLKVGYPFGLFEGLQSALIGFLIGFKGLYILADTSRATKNVILSFEGDWLWGLVLALAFPAYKFWERSKELKLHPQPKEIEQPIWPHERVGDIVVISAISGVLGAKLLFLVGYYDPKQTFLEQLFNGSGLTVYGGMILAFMVVSYYGRKWGIPFLQLIDSAAPSLMLAYGVGRLGCHFSGDGDWGSVNPWAASKPGFVPDWLWAYRYPNNVIAEGVPMENCGYPADFGDYCTILPEAVFPTPVFEFIMAASIFAFLWWLRHRLKVPGLLFSIYLIFNGLERFAIEIIRVNEKHEFSGFTLSQAQYIAIALFIIGLGFTIYLYPKQKAAVAESAKPKAEE